MRLVAAFAVCASFLGVPSVGGAAPTSVGATPTVFVAIDSVSVYGSSLTLVGVVEGEAAPSEWLLRMASSSDLSPYAQAEACQRLALLVMSKPGAYRLEVSKRDSFTAPVCTLSRVTP